MNFNIPNSLSVMRILLIPVFLWTYLTASGPEDYYIAAGILVFSGLSDTVDGFIARRFHMITQLGKILDPMADKLTLASVICALWIRKPQWWPLYALLIAKDVLMLLGGIRLMKKNITIEGAKWFGKLSTVMFYVIMVIIIARPDLPDTNILVMLMVLALFMIFSFARYCFLFLRMIRSSNGR
ncbi:CDP-alcohol phosphatidyltransferase family protein [Youxingia wuxianensis]|uniref:CDP-diacylglycerol--glycerol-3-phosphate 3-phosphatidyltransferase n=1 Tax=Youxingia wuxianensis TaxID=2763678 RepID=A0A926IGJ6_9FIRM|nr:CDP-alcohol phosphatidyltransferase family protein [Youxingia wuxianensis]MBC8584939.1 CDP-alcohol phosphatidyltransferase family protein [Youxingia wuxianensis]